MYEASVEKRSVAHVKASGGEAIKLKGRGLPDRLFLLDGICLFVEFKRGPKDAFQPLQQRWLRRLRNVGFEAWVVHDFGDFTERLARLRSDVALKRSSEAT